MPAVQADTSLKSWLALGDSYTIGQSVAASDRYPVQTVNILKGSGINFKAPEIIATTGWTTGDLQNAINGKKTPLPPYDIVSLLIGVNNQYQGRTQAEYKDQFTALLLQSIQLAGNNPSHVIVISIPDYSVTPFAHGRDTVLIASGIDSFNMINKEAATNYNVQYINIAAESRKAATDPTLIADDGLHFSGKEYAIWAGILVPVIKAIVK